jgi:hypothetical protein
MTMPPLHVHCASAPSDPKVSYIKWFVVRLSNTLSIFWDVATRNAVPVLSAALPNSLLNPFSGFIQDLKPTLVGVGEVEG